MRIRLSCSFPIAVLILCPFLTGCGDSLGLAPVSGQVTIDGEPLKYGSIQVIPEGAPAAYGTIGSDGRFTLETGDGGDGVVKGTHKVAVVANEPQGAGGQMWHAPMKYRDFQTSGVTLTVDGPTDDAKIELTWDGGKPFVEKFAPE
jgi:hypothetical protein